MAKSLGLIQNQVKRPPATLGKPSIKAQVIHIINKPMPGGLPKKTSRALLDNEDNRMVPVIRDPKKVNEDSEAVFYFPGCGSERLFGQVGLATQAMLYEVGAITVLPPGYLCCGYPQTSAGEAEKGHKISTDNRVLFQRVANTLNYLDIHEYLLEKNVRLEGVTGVRYMYHDPCHSPMKTHQPQKVVSTLMGVQVELNDRCCGESGTLAVTLPDISTPVRFRKVSFTQSCLMSALHARPQRSGTDGPPSCRHLNSSACAVFHAGPVE